MGVADRLRWASPPMLVAAAAFLAAALASVVPDPGGHVAAGSRRISEGLPRLEILPPGTRIEGGPPPGWSQVVVKTVPRLATGAVGSLPASAASTAGSIHTLVLADVRGGRLLRVGVGLGLPDRGGEVVATAASLETLGLDLSWVARRVLEYGDRDIARSRLVARTPTFAVFETPTRMVVGGHHRDVWVRHALLAGPGADLAWWIWAIRKGEGGGWLVRGPVGLTSGYISDGTLDVAVEHALGPVPLKFSFAMNALPPGLPLPLTRALRELTAAETLTGPEAGTLERDLRAASRQAAGMSAPVGGRHENGMHSPAG